MNRGSDDGDRAAAAGRSRPRLLPLMFLDAAAASGSFRGRLEAMADVDQFTGAVLEFRF